MRDRNTIYLDLSDLGFEIQGIYIDSDDRVCYILHLLSKFILLLLYAKVNCKYFYHGRLNPIELSIVFSDLVKSREGRGSLSV